MLSDRFQAISPQGPKGLPPKGHSWTDFMSIALAEAQRAAAQAEVPVGAAIFSATGALLAAAGNRTRIDHDPTAHAEILAIRLAAKKLANERLFDCLMVVTLEPCLMCAAAIKEARMAGIVFGARDSVAGAIVSRLDYAEMCGTGREIWHLGGIMATACAEILQKFFSERR